MTLRFINDPRQSTSAGWRERQDRAAARHAAQVASYTDPEQVQVREYRAQLMAAHAEAEATARARAEYDQPVAPTAQIIANGALHRTKLAAIVAFLETIGATGTGREALSVESLRKAAALMPGATSLIWPPDHVEEAAAPAAEAPRGRGRPPKSSNSIVVDTE